VGDSWLLEAVFRQNPELWVRVGFIKLCVIRDWIVRDIWLHDAVCRRRPEQWVTVGYMKLFL